MPFILYFVLVLSINEITKKHLEFLAIKYFYFKPTHLNFTYNFLQIQFVGIMVHAFQLLFIDCNYPRAFVWWIGMHAVMFFFLFKEFYNQAYNNRKSQKAAVEANGHSKQNGALPQNGHVKENGVSSKKGTASEYYMNGTTDISQRIKSQ